MTLASILVVDGDPTAQQQIVAGLRDLGHHVSATENANDALIAMQATRPDLLVCEYQLPDATGVDFLADLKGKAELGQIRVLMTSESSSPDEAVRALESGADDFIGKPLQMPVFLARVDACLRRPAAAMQPDVVRAGGIAMDNVGHRVTVHGESLTLAPREYRLLEYLLNNQDRVFSRRQLLMAVWDRDASIGPRTVDVYMRRLRFLLEPYACDKYVQTVRGSGYRFSLDT